MGQPDPKWYLLSVILLAFFAIMIPRWFQGRAYSDKQAHQICSEIYAKYGTLAESKASNEEWDSLQAEALPQLDAIAADHEANLEDKTPASTTIYQVAKYSLPQVIQEKGNPTDKRKPEAIAKELATAERIIMAPPVAEKPKKSIPEPNQGWDPVVIVILVGDVVLALAGGGYWFWKT